MYVFQGQGIYGSSLIQGMVFKRQVEGDVKKANNCKVAVYSCPLDLMQTETKVSSCLSEKDKLQPLYDLGLQNVDWFAGSM